MPTLPDSKRLQRFLEQKPAYRDHLARFFTAAGVRNEGEILTLKRGQAHEAVDALKLRYTNGTIHTTLSAARELYRWLYDREIIERNPLADFRFRGKKSVPMWNVLHPGEIEPVLAAAGSSENPIRDTAVIQTLIDHGFRASELGALRWDMVTVEDGKTIVEYSGKGGKILRKRLKQTTLDTVRAWLKSCGKKPSGPVPFIPADRTGAALERLDIYAIVRGACKRAGVVRKLPDGREKYPTPHGLRATNVSRLVAERGIAAAKKITGHEDIGTTQRYDRWAVLDEEEIDE